MQGRPLHAYELGDPAAATTVLVVGCIHGTECEGLRVVRALRARHPRAHLWLVPNANPDGYAHRSRTNANGVDLNRDFFRRSQPETRALAAFVRRVRPDVTIWFHQPENRVRAWGSSVAVARRFAKAARLPFAAVRWPRGSASNWQNTRLHRRSFVVELPAGRLPDTLARRLVNAVLAV